MFLSRLASSAAVSAAVLWAAKAVAIGVAGGLGKSPLEGPLFLLGMLALLTAIVALALCRSATGTRGARVLAVAGTLVATIVLVVLLNLLVGVVQPDDPGWAWGEVNLWVLAGAVLVAALARPGLRGSTSAVASDFR